MYYSNRYVLLVMKLSGSRPFAASFSAGKTLRRDIARIHTIVRERELGIRTAPSSQE